MAKTKVSVNICGSDYVILSDESESYVRTIALEVDEQINESLKNNIRKSLSKAAILVAMNYCDKSKKLQDEMDVYLKTIKQDQDEIKKLKRQIENLKKNKIN